MALSTSAKPVNRTQTLSGSALARLTITLEAVSQSVLVMYKVH